MNDREAEKVSQMIVDLENLIDGQDDSMGKLIDAAAHMIDDLAVRVNHLEIVADNLKKENVRLIKDSVK